MQDLVDTGEPIRVHELHELGRFSRNMARGRSMWFQGRAVDPPVAGRLLGCPEHTDTCIPLTDAWVYRSPYGCVQVSLRGTLSPDLTEDLGEVLRCTCHERDSMSVDGVHPALDLIDAVDISPTGGFGVDVHAVVALPAIPAGWTRTDSVRIVYRETERTPSDVPVAEPGELNRFVGQVGMHGRGVTLLIGHDPHTVSACTLIAQGLLMLIQQIRSLELRATSLLTEASTIAAIDSQDGAADRIDRIATLAQEVQRLDVIVATEVESVFTNGSLPEIILDSYRDSLARTLGVRDAIDATSRTLSKVRGFISAEFERLASDHRERIAQRESARALAAAAASAVFLPSSLFFAALSIGTPDVHHNTSIFSGYYEPLWVTYISVVAIGLIIVAIFGLRRR
jgi:hypothetical protein